MYKRIAKYCSCSIMQTATQTTMSHAGLPFQVLENTMWVTESMYLQNQKGSLKPTNKFYRQTKTNNAFHAWL